MTLRKTDSKSIGLTDSIYEQWERLLTREVEKGLSQLQQRRSFLKSVALLPLLPAIPGLALLSGCSGSEQSASHSASRSKLIKPQPWQREPWRTYESVYSFILPTGKNSPGSKEIFAVRYLYFALQQSDIDPEIRKFMQDSVGWLNAYSQKRYQKTFAEVTDKQKEAILRAIEKNKAGDHWLAYSYRYLMEALLADPVYGGNVNQVGWKWLQHKPGFPRPPAHKRYFNLR